MKILITTHQLRHREGSELFTIDLACKLQQRGHQIFIYSPLLGPVAQELPTQNITISDNLTKFASEKFDLIHAQHRTTAILARSLFSQTPIVMMIHGLLPLLEQPPSIDLDIAQYLVVSEETSAHLSKKYNINQDKIQIVRNFIDNTKFISRVPTNSQLRNILVVSNRFTAKEQALVQSACQQLNLNYQHIGLPDHPVINVVDYINQADLVITLGRGALEAMACQRNVIVFDIHGGDGFVDEESFFEIRKNNFSGRRYAKQYTVEDLISELKKYDPALGPKLRQLVCQNNSPEVIINQLESIYQTVQNYTVTSSQITPGQLFPEINYLEQELAHHINGYQSVIDTLQKLIDEKTQLVSTKDQELQILNQRLQEITALEQNLRSSTSWKITQPLRSIGDLVKSTKNKSNN